MAAQNDDKGGEGRTPGKSVTRRSWFGLNLANFLLAEVVSVVMPFLNAYLKEKGWAYDAIGVTVAVAGLGTLLAQLPAGILCDEIRKRRLLLGACSLVVGLCYAGIPLTAKSPLLTDISLFVAGAASACFVPLLATLALSLVGHRGFDRIMGANQCWNHAGNIAAGLLAFACVHLLGITSVFYTIGILSLMAAASLLIIRGGELNPDLGGEKNGKSKKRRSVRDRTHDVVRILRRLLRSRDILVLIACVALFHLANSPAMPLVALYFKHMGHNDDYVAGLIIIAQAVMVPVAVLTAKYCTSWGRKPVFAVAFIALTVRLALYIFITNPALLLGIQVLDGMGAGIFGVVIALICGDLTQGKAGFNTLLGLMQTCVALGGFLGPLMQGFITQHMGFPAAFSALAAVAAAGTLLFLFKMPETRKGDSGKPA